MTCGIYEICNTKTTERYVGFSTRMEERWEEHFRLLQRGKHERQPKLQTAWNLYGPEKFRFRVLEVISILAEKKFLYERERFWQHKFKAKLYNETRCGVGARPKEHDENTFIWPFPAPTITPRRHHLGPPPDIGERRSVMYSGRRDHIRLKEIQKEQLDSKKR